MRKRFISLFFALALSLFLIASVSVAKGEDLHKEGEYLVLGTVKNSLLIDFLLHAKKGFHASSKESFKACTGLVLDSEKLTNKQIKESKAVKVAIQNSIPIIMANPSRSNIYAVSGIELADSEGVVIVPKRNGEEFEIHVIRQSELPKMKASMRDNPFIHTMNYVLANHKPQRNSKKNDPSPSQSHKRYTVLDVYATKWGPQCSWIHVGFQYDLYYICEPKPVRKYLLMRTIGAGVSSGYLQHNHPYHRGYYQNKVFVEIEGYGHDGWTGPRLQLEEYAPQSENTANQEQNTMGILFSMSGIAGVSALGNTAADNSAMSAGIAVYDQHAATSKFDDFTVSFMPSATSEQWMFWMNGAEGSKVRKNHQTWDVVSNRHVFFSIKELPQLANYSVLQPDVQALYYTSGDQKGKWTLTGTVEQHLQDVKCLPKCSPIYVKTKKMSNAISQKVTIDFSEVTGDDAEVCQK